MMNGPRMGFGLGQNARTPIIELLLGSLWLSVPNIV